MKKNFMTEKTKQPRWLVSILLWLLAITYTYLLLLSPPNLIVPGNPVWAIAPETVREILSESLNFFFVLPILNRLGIGLMQSPVVHPIAEAFFNFAEAWIFMFLPLLLADRRGRNLPRVWLWSLAMFLTNVFLIPYMALRATQPLQLEGEYQKGGLARGFGGTALVVSTIAILWGCLALPEFGDLTARLDYFVEQLQTNRVTIAFAIDLVLFYLFQVILLGAIEPVGSKKRSLRFLPFWGLAIWLII